MTTYDVSVIIPVFNSQNTIVRAIQSVIDQTFLGNVEIIVIDDGSTDNSAQIVSNYRQAHPEAEISLIQQENKGVSSARNTGMKQAKGNWIALLDSDDEWLPTKLVRQFDVVNSNPDVDFLGTTRNNEHFDRIYFKPMSWLTKISPRLLLYKFVFVVPTILFRREILNSIGYFNESQRYAEEGNYFIRICNQYNCYLLNESHVITGGGKAHFGESGLSGNLKEMEKGELKNIYFAYNSKIIGLFEYLFLVLFSLLKYLRRIIFVSLRKNN